MKISRYIAFLLALLMIFGVVVAVPLDTKAEINPVQNYFLRVIGSAARASYYESNVLASLTIGQGIYESGWGRSTLAIGARNLFGIKAFSTWSGKVFNQRDKLFYDSYNEYLFVSGQTHVNTTSAWRAHATWLESVKSHNDLFVNSSRYEKIVGEKNYKTAAHLLVSSGYCTDAGYAENVISIIESNNLTAYDNITPDSDGIVALVADADRKFVDIGETFTLGINFYPSNKKPSKITWASDNKSVATVDSKGNVKAVGHGTALITATLANGREACCIVYVDCNATVIDSDVNVRSSASSSASSKGVLRRGSGFKVTSDTLVSDSSGNRFYAVKGTTKDGNIVTGYVDEDYVYLSKRNPTAIKVVKNDITLTVNEKYTVYNVVTPADAADKTLTWKSSNTSVATVNQSGVITALKTGKATITATAVGGAKVDITVNVASSKRNYSAMITAYQSVTIRDTASSSGTSLGRIAFMEEVTVIGEPNGRYYNIKGTNTSGKEITGYVSSDYVLIIPDGVTVSYGTAGDNFGIYQSANTSSRKYATLTKGTKFAVLNKIGDWSFVLGLTENDGAKAVSGYSPLGETVTDETSDALTIKETITGYKGKTTGSVNIRNGAGTSYTSLGTVASGTDVTVIGTETNGWYKVSLLLNSKQTVGYCSSQYITMLSEGTTTSNLNLRSSASTSSSALTQIPLGKTVSIIGDKNNGWYKVEYNGITGYCSADYITISPKTISTIVNAVGTGLTYKWYFKNKGDSNFTLTTTFTGNTYKVEMNESRAGRQIYCVVTDKNGNTAKSDVVTLTMGTALQITQQPKSTQANNGKTLTVSLSANGDNLTYKWYYKNKNDSKFTLTTTFTGNTYSVTMNSDRASRQIYCVITDKYGNSQTTETVTLGMSAMITKQPVSVTVKDGENANVTISASGEGLTYKWYYKNRNDSDFALTTSFTGNTYTVTMNDDRASRQIYCVVTDKYGNSVKSNTVTLGIAVKIIEQPKNVAVTEGSTATVTVTALGEGLTYKWYFKNKGANKFSLTTTFTDNTYFAIMNDERASRQVYCVITDASGNSVTTETVTLGMSASITQQPVSVFAQNGEMATVTLSASGEGLTYKWYFKNKSDSEFTLTNTFTGNSYFVTMNDDRTLRQVYCVVTDKYGNTVQSEVATLIMGTPLQITEQPKSTQVNDGEIATVSVSAIGDDLTYKWYFKNKGDSEFTLTNTFTDNTYFVAMNSTRASRQIYCVITDKYGNTVTTETVTLGMTVSITTQPVSVAVPNGQTATVTFTASGEDLTYKWYFKNKGDRNFTLTNTFADNTYFAIMNSTRASRQIYCVITDKYGNTVTTETVTLGMTVSITTQPVSISVPNGQTATVTFTASGEDLTYKWYYKNKGDSEFTLTNTFTGNTYSATMNSTRASRQIYCVITDKYGNTVTTKTVTLGMSVSITTQPKSVTVSNGKEARVSVTASGEGLTYKWYYKNKGDSKFTLTTSFTGNSYYVTMTNARASRQIYCVITDKYGNSVTTNTVTLKKS